MKPGRRIPRAFLVALTLTVCTASIVLAWAEGSLWPVGLTPVIALLAAGLNGLTTRVSLPGWLANVLGVVAIGAAVAELVYGGTEARLLSGAHLVAWFTWIVLFLKQSDRRLWWLLALSVLQLALASVLHPSPLLGAALVSMLFLMVWTLSLFTLYRLRRRVLSSENEPGNQQEPQVGVRVRHGIQSDSGMRWIGWRFRSMILALSVAALAMSGLVFAAFPRVFVGLPTDLRGSGIDHLGLIAQTGFREEVSLDEFGPLLQSNTRVAEVSFHDEASGQEISLERFLDRMQQDELRLRGTAQGWYSDGRWTRGLQAHGFESENQRHDLSPLSLPTDSLRVRVTQDAPIGRFAFAPRPIVSTRIVGESGRLMERMLTRSLTFEVRHNMSWQVPGSGNLNSVPITFDVWCPLPWASAERQPPRQLPDSLRRWLFPNALPGGWDTTEEQAARQFALTRDLRQTLPQLCRLSDTVCQTAAERPAADVCAQRIHRFLTGDRFSYSLSPGRTDRSLDPVEDFLLNHRTGHCQYFASAAALMLQAQGIPARVVNGFRGGEHNPETGRIEIQQKFAHVWLEYRDHFAWHTLDPTPASREQAVQQAVTPPGMLGNLQETVSSLWDAGINNVNGDRQRQLIAPLLDAVRRAADVLQQDGVAGLLRLLLGDLGPTLQRWFNWRGVAGILLVGGALFYLLREPVSRWLQRLADRWPGLRWLSRSRQASIVRFYEQFCQTCAQAGLDFPGHQTASENAAAAVDHFQHILPADIRLIPARIAAAFNEVRFGNQPLSETRELQLAEDLQALQQTLRSPEARSGAPVPGAEPAAT